MGKNDADPPAKISAGRQPTKLMLVQQLQEQMELIEQLNERIQQKEQELQKLRKSESLLGQLSGKLQTLEAKMAESAKYTSEQSSLMESLKARLEQKESLVSSMGEQATLIDELTAKLQETEIKLAAASILSKHETAQNIVKTHMIASMALGLLPAPLFDIAALTGTQLNQLRTLSRHYNVDFNEQTGRAVLTSLISGAAPVLTVIGLSSIVKIIPGIGTIGGGISMTALAGAFTYATGQVFIRHFEAGGTFQNFESKHWQAFFKQQLEEGKAFVKYKLDAAGGNPAETQEQVNKLGE